MSVINKPMRDECYVVVVVFLILVITGGPAAVGATPHFVYTRCFETAGNYTPKSLFQSNLNSLLSDLVVVALNSSYSYSNSIGESPDEVVHGLFYCRGDVAPAECGGCAQAAAARVALDCPSEKEAVIWFEECTLRYTAGQVDDVENVWVSQQTTTTNSISVPADVYRRLFDGLVKEAAYNNLDNGSMVRYFRTGKTAVTSAVSLEGLVQCAPQMSERQCEGCLRTSVGVIPSCCGWQREWVTVARPSCLVEYRYADVVDRARQRSPSSSSSSSSPSSSSGSLLVPDAHSAWGYIKYFLILAAGIAFVTVINYTLVRKLRHVLYLIPRWPQPEEISTKKTKPEESKETTKPTKPECKECSTHKCGSCSINDDRRVVLVPIPSHWGGYPANNLRGYPPRPVYPPSHWGGPSFPLCEG